MFFGVVASFLLLILSGSTAAQVLTTAETLGKGRAVTAAENHLWVDGASINGAWVEYAYALSPRFDLYLYPVWTISTGGQNQQCFGIGGNFHLFQYHRIDAALFNVWSTPLSRQKQASTVLSDVAPIVNYEFKNKKWPVPYSGLNFVFPVGATSRGPFTPPGKEVNVPAGAAFSWRKMTFFIEGDFWSRNNAAALAATYSW
jgi:hypothetical protein